MINIKLFIIKSKPSIILLIFLQQALDYYADRVTGRWACLCIHGHLVATSSDFQELDPREARLLLLLASAQEGAPLRDTPVYLPHMSPNVC